MNEIQYIILLPLAAGLLLLAIPEKIKMVKGIFATLVSAITFVFAIVFFSGKLTFSALIPYSPHFIQNIFIDDFLVKLSRFDSLYIDGISKMTVLLVCFFSTMILIYSLSYFNRKHKIYNYHGYFLITQACTAAAMLVNNLLLFIFFWGVLAITLFKLIKGHDDESASAAKKTLILVGASDSFMLIGLAILWKMTSTLDISHLSVNTTSISGVVAFLFLLIGCFTKAGAFPFHTWVPEYTKKAPAPSSAYMPASLDKLLGIYFLYRLCSKIFILNEWLTLTILILAVMTIIFAVMMALVQNNTKKLLGYHAVSQVGYMVLGLGLGTPLGIAGGLFHMINHTLYKSGLFLVAGDIESRTGSDNIEHLGGLARAMPLTFISALIFSLSISGIPPLNGFASKWMIYQGIVDFGKGSGIANHLWMVWLALAVLGSALTLASFIKLLAGVFLGRKTEFYYEKKEVSFVMCFPIVVLALLCVIIGLFASSWFIPKFISPLSGGFNLTGTWNSPLAGTLIVVSIIIGVLIYLIGKVKNFRAVDNYVGGEKDQEVEAANVTEFYKTISEQNFLAFFYKKAEQKVFDLYEILKNITLKISAGLSKLHTGILNFYAVWIILGLLVLLIFLLKF